MQNKDFYKMTNDELLVEKQKMKNSKIFSAVFMGYNLNNNRLWIGLAVTFFGLALVFVGILLDNAKNK